VLAERAAAGDIWLPDGSRVDLQRTVVIGSRLDVLTPERDTDEPVVAARFHRQSLIFVATGQAILGGAKVGIVGAGGVGMLLVQSLARTVLSVRHSLTTSCRCLTLAVWDLAASVTGPRRPSPAIARRVSISVWPGVRRIRPTEGSPMATHAPRAANLPALLAPVRLTLPLCFSAGFEPHGAAAAVLFGTESTLPTLETTFRPATVRSSGIAAQLTAPTHGVSNPMLTLLLQAGQVMHELLCGRSHLGRQPRGDSIVHRGGGGEQLVGAT
jgi:hypothetical protein